MTIRFKHSIPTGYFEAMYAANSDPWRFASSSYEREKYAATLAALPRQRYERALEVGCSIGVFTRELGARCASVLALDPVEDALDQARVGCDGLSHVRFDRCRAPDQWPDGSFDLILLSEMVYYLDRPDIVALAARVRSSITPGGDIVLVHWLGGTHYPLSGDDAAEDFLSAADSFALPLHQSRTAAYRLDVLRARQTSDKSSQPAGVAAEL